ncbi:hypothetical protein [Agarivorans sp. DSG3-1]|uniref:hypothetical protein n=1 Tax=Agarivorans sp. DSG3-1 TaxID=3342249 RepID=UPI00398F4010
MKRNAIAFSIAALLGMGLTTSVSAITLYETAEGDYVKLNGRIEVGGWFGKSHNDLGEEWTWYQGYADDTFADISFEGRTGDVYGVLDIDFERMTWTQDNEFQTVLDKVYVGWEFLPEHFVEFGRNDTAYDDVDSHGDFSVDSAREVKEAGDQDNTIKYQGSYNNVQMGMSYSLRGWDEYLTDSREGAVFNGYVGYFANNWSLLFGGETAKEYGEIYSLHGTYFLGDWGFGGLVSVEDRQEENGYLSQDNIIAVLSASYQITSTVEAVVTYSNISFDEEYKYYEEEQVNEDWFTVGVNYHYRPNVRLAAEVTSGGEDGTFSYAKLYYSF